MSIDQEPATPLLFDRLLVDARTGNREALGKILKSYERILLHAARRELPADLQAKGGASDLVQDTFLEAHRDFTRFYGRTEGELIAWLQCLLRHNFANFVRDYRQREKRQISREQPLWTECGYRAVAPDSLASKSAGPLSDLIRCETMTRLHHAVSQLPDEYREVVRLRFVERLSFADVGSSLNVSEEAARKLVCRAVRKLGIPMEWA
jgi:RNA polymerase sigma-70 factor, ECF subfamily